MVEKKVYATLLQRGFLSSKIAKDGRGRGRMDVCCGELLVCMSIAIYSGSKPETQGLISNVNNTDDHTNPVSWWCCVYWWEFAGGALSS